MILRVGNFSRPKLGTVTILLMVVDFQGTQSLRLQVSTGFVLQAFLFTGISINTFQGKHKNPDMQICK